MRVTTGDILWATLAYNTNQLSTAIHWTAGGQVPATFAKPLRIYFTFEFPRFVSDLPDCTIDGFNLGGGHFAQRRDVFTRRPNVECITPLDPTLNLTQIIEGTNDVLTHEIKREAGRNALRPLSIRLASITVNLSTRDFLFCISKDNSFIVGIIAIGGIAFLAQVWVKKTLEKR